MGRKTTKSRTTKHSIENSLPDRWCPQWWEQADGRSKVVRLVRERVEQLREDTGADSAQRELLVSRAAFLSCLLETWEVQAAQGGDIDISKWTQACNTLIGLLSKLGLDKKVREVDLQEYLDRKKKEKGKRAKTITVRRNGKR